MVIAQVYQSLQVIAFIFVNQEVAALAEPVLRHMGKVILHADGTQHFGFQPAFRFPLVFIIRIGIGKHDHRSAQHVAFLPHALGQGKRRLGQFAEEKLLPEDIYIAEAKPHTGENTGQDIQNEGTADHRSHRVEHSGVPAVDVAPDLTSRKCLHHIFSVGDVTGIVFVHAEGL